jgi:photosystem II stability/assembly factor-like uncharacterized protein
MQTPIIAVLSCNGGTVTTGLEPASRLLVGTLQGIYIFERQSGGRWVEKARALSDLHISCILHEPRSGRIFAGAHWGGGLFVSTDGGFSFSACMQGIHRKHIYTLAAQYRGESCVLFAGSEPSALYRSDDLGATWRDLPGIRDVPETEQWKFPPPPHIAHVKNVAWHPSDPRRLFVCIEQGALLISADDGQTWAENRSYADPNKDMFRHDNHRVLFQSDPRCYFMCGGEGIHFTADDGVSWRQLMSRQDRIGYPDAMFIDPRDDQVIYVAGPRAGPGLWTKFGTADPTFMRSRDGGLTWEEKRAGLPQDLIGNIEAMGLHWVQDQVAIYAGTATGEVYETDDAGEHWQTIASGLPAIAKNGHYRYFLDPQDKARAEEMMRACGAAYD